MKAILATALLLSVAGAAEGQSAHTTAGAVLDANHVAVGPAPTTGVAEFDYSHTGSGLTGPASMRFDLATGAYVEAQDAGGMHNSDGFDGRTPWQQDIS